MDKNGRNKKITESKKKANAGKRSQVKYAPKTVKKAEKKEE